MTICSWGIGLWGYRCGGKVGRWIVAYGKKFVSLCREAITGIYRYAVGLCCRCTGRW